MITVKREGVIIEPSMFSYNENNINGPSLIKVPDWIENPLGKYYLYFANHGGKYIRMAYSDKVTGPYTIHENGTLRLEQSPGHDHIASPDVHIDNEKTKDIDEVLDITDPTKLETFESKPEKDIVEHNVIEEVDESVEGVEWYKNWRRDNL